MNLEKQLFKTSPSKNLEHLQSLLFTVLLEIYMHDGPIHFNKTSANVNVVQSNSNKMTI